MNIASYIFSFLCSQDPTRSFVIAGAALPFCQRCTGVYLGLGIGFIYLLAAGHYKKGLPPRSILYVNIAALLMMPVFGFHLVDPGPAWRLWSGLIFGNAVAFLLLPATSIIYNQGRTFGRYTRISTFRFFVFFAFLNTIPLWFPIHLSCFYYGVLILATLALAVVLFCVVVITSSLIRKFLASLILKGFAHECRQD